MQGLRPGINNAISRVAALLAVAAFGALLADTFQGALDRNLNHLGVSPAAAAHVEAQRQALPVPKQRTRWRDKRLTKLLLLAIASSCG
jgi:hypothetical protein